jgi:transposase InsO family protein
LANGAIKTIRTSYTKWLGYLDNPGSDSFFELTDGHFRPSTGHQIQRLRIDNGGKYVNSNFTNYCTTQGIQMQHNVPYTPQQNGVAERKNRTLKEMANCMIQSNRLSLKYWAEDINCANYIVNHTPTKESIAT